MGNRTRRTAHNITCPGGTPVLAEGTPVLEVPPGRTCDRTGIPPRRDMGTESGEKTRNMTGAPPPPWIDKQTEIIAFPHPSDAGGKYGKYWGGGPQSQALSQVSGPRSFSGVPLTQPEVPQCQPETKQQSEHLLHGGRYASCGHAGGLSC